MVSSITKLYPCSSMMLFYYILTCIQMISFFGPFTWVSVPCVIQNQKWNYFIYRTYSDQFEWRHVIVLVHVSRKLMFVDVYLYRWIQTDISAAQELRADPDRSWPGRLFNNVIYYWVSFDNNSTTKPCSYCQHTKLNFFKL